MLSGLQAARHADSEFALEKSIVGDVLVVRFTGEATEKNANAMVRRYFDLVLGCGARKVLADLRQLEGRLSGSKTYFLMRNLPVKPVPRGIKTAVVESPDHGDYADFLENTAANAGIYLTSFLDYGDALAWLNSPRP